MHLQLIDKILDAGRNAAYSKMSLERNSEKPDMRAYGFHELHRLIKEEMNELGDEFRKMVLQGDRSEELLIRIRNEAGDVIAFASGIVAKCDQEVDKIHFENSPSLFDEAQ